ncbi:MAG: hypothetical protein AAFZ07_02150 [Actinomycetota bacterium]
MRPPCCEICDAESAAPAAARDGGPEAEIGDLPRITRLHTTGANSPLELPALRAVLDLVGRA